MVVAGDMLLSLHQWMGRIHMGRWKERGRWQQALRKQALKQLKSLPIVPIKGDVSYPFWNNHIRRKNRSRALQSWQLAGLVMGLEKNDLTDDTRIINTFFNRDEQRPEIALLGFALKQKNLLTKAQEEAIYHSLETLTGPTGTILYRTNIPNVRFVDTIGFICPFLYAAGKEELADRQIKEYDRALFNGIFPAHAWHMQRNLPLGVFDWGRGVGWYILGCIASEQHRDRCLRLAEHLLSLQREDGSFGCFLFNLSSQKDSSATVLAGILFAHVFQQCGDKRYGEAATKAEKALMSMTRRNGLVDFAQGDTKGMGLYSDYFSTMPFVQGMTLYLSKRLDDLLSR